MEKKNVPKIRFPGFTEPWEQRKLKDVFISLQNNTLSRAELSDKEGIAKNVHYGDILIKFGECLDIKKYTLPLITEESIIVKYKSSFLQNGDIIVADTAEDETVGKCSEIEGLEDEIVLSGLHTIAYRPMFRFASGYLGYYMNSNLYHNQLLPLIQGIKVSSISKSAMQDTIIMYPKLIDEQAKIGEFFKQLDNLISLHHRKLENLKKQKKGLLQKMFPEKGKKVPEIRFPEFTNDWEQRKLCEVAEIVSGGTPSTTNKEYWDGDIDWYTPAEINNQIYVEGSERKITELGLKKSSAKILPAHKTVLFTSRAGIGKMAILYKPGTTNQGFQSIVLNNNTDSYFVYSMGSNIKEKAEKVASGSTFAEISGKALGNLKFMFPNEEEQVKIGAFFKQLDNLISLHQRKLEHLQKQKKALLQQMFV